MKKSIAIVGLLASAPLWAAEGLSYNSVDLDWIASADVEAAGASDDGDGFGISGVFSFSDMLFVTGEYRDVGYDVIGDLTELSLGVGAHSNAYTGAIDLYGVLSYENLEALGGDEDGFGIEIGARTMLMDNLDGFISYEYADLSDVDGGFFNIGGSYALTPNWAAVVEYKTGDYDVTGGEIERDDLSLSARYNF